MKRSMSCDVCTVCHEHMDIFAIGPCNHPICYRCSCRMRILCEQLYCPICRGDLSKVVFVQDLIRFENLHLEKFRTSKRSIYLENEAVEKAYQQLLTFQCKTCPNRPADKTMVDLRDHLRKEHTLFLCDLCLKHLNIFPFERKFYNRKDLATHRRVGDADDKSYKGHPLCQFCDERYMDNDELLRHLRKDHYFCHFCDADGSNEYYIDYPDLKTHFRDSHFLCEEEECGSPTTHFTNAFRSNIDLKAHKASQHTKGMSKSQIREASRLDIEIQLPPRRTGRDRGRNTGREYGNTGREYEETNQGGRGRGYGNNGRGRGGGYYGNRDSYLDTEREELERAIEASKRDAPGVKKMSWSAEDIRQDFPALSSQETTSTTNSNSTNSATGAAPSTTSSVSTVPTNSKPVTSMAAKLSSDKVVDNNAKAFPQLKKSSAKLNHNNKTDKSGRNSPVIKDKKTTGRSSPVARVIQPIPASKKAAEEDFPDLSSQKNRNSNLISLGVWKQKNQRTDSVRPNIPVEKPKPSSSVPKSKPVSHSLSDVGRSLCAKSDFSGKSEKSSSSKPNNRPVTSSEKDFPGLGGKSEKSYNTFKPDNKPIKTSEKDFPGLGGKSEKSYNTFKPDNKPIKTSEKDFPGLGGKSEKSYNTFKPDNKPIKTSEKDFPGLGGKSEKSYNSFSADSKPITSSLKDFPGLGGKTIKPDVSKNNSTWGQKKAKKQTKAAVDEEFEIPSAAINPPTNVTKIEDSKIDNDSQNDSNNSKNKKKKKKKNKDNVDNSDLTIETTTSSNTHNDASKFDKNVSENLKKPKQKQTGPVASLDGIAMGLLKEEKNQVSPQSSKQKDTSKMLASKPTDLSSSSSKSHHVEVPKSVPMPEVPITDNISSLTDYPILSTPAKAPPPGFQKSTKKNPPPGFGNQPKSRPPPGFSKQDERKPEPAPKPLVLDPSFTYVQPTAFQERNQQLVTLVRETLGETGKFDEFKTKSWQYRQNKIIASEYYHGCEKLMGTEKFVEIFPELLILLPDIKKQHDLLNIHNQSSKKLNNNSVIKISDKHQKASWSVFSDFIICPTCSQVLLRKDNATHSANHSATDFPVLGRSKGSTNDFMGRGSWVAAK